MSSGRIPAVGFIILFVVLLVVNGSEVKPPLLTATLDGLYIREGQTWNAKQLTTSLYTRSVDYHWRRGYVFWSTSYYPGSVMRAKLHPDGDLSSIITVASPDHPLFGIKQIAVDWIHDNLYYFNFLYPKGDQAIYVANLDGSAKKAIYIMDYYVPNKMTLDPFKKYIYFPTSRHLIRIGMDGSGKTKIASIFKAWEIYLTIDFDEDLLYYYNPSSETLNTMTSDGKEVKQITSLPYRIKYLNIYKDDIYFVGRWEQTRRLYNIKRFNLIDETIYEMDNDTRITDFIIYDQSVQKQGLNVCSGLNHGCSHLCLASPTNSNGFVCECEDGYRKYKTEQGITGCSGG